MTTDDLFGFLNSTQKKKRNDILQDKTVYCFGDSLMSSKSAILENRHDEHYGWRGGYPYYLEQLHPNTTIYNLGSPNGALCPATVTALQSMGQDAPYIPNVIKDKLTGKTDVDYILLNGCGNDIYVNAMQGLSLTTLFGSVSDTVPTTADYSTICGSLENTFYWLVTNFSNAKIIYLSLPPIKQFYSIPSIWNVEVETTLNDLIESICNNYGITFVNLAKTILRRDLNFASGFFYDSDVHLTDAGYIAVMDIVDKAF